MPNYTPKMGFGLHLGWGIEVLSYFMIKIIIIIFFSIIYRY